MNVGTLHSTGARTLSTVLPCMLVFPVMALGQGLVHEGYKKELAHLFSSTITDLQQSHCVSMLVLKGVP